MANNNYYGYTRNPKKVNLQGARGSVDLEFESVNPYEFKKGMNAELAKLGVTGLRESNEEQREKATESVIKNLKDVPAYYSMMEHYETITNRMQGRKPTFKSFVKEMEDHSMKEIKEKFTIDKAIEIRLKESVRAEVRAKINELFKNK